MTQSPRVRAVIAVATLLLVSAALRPRRDGGVSTDAGVAVAENEESEAEGPQRQKEYFDAWLGGSFDEERNRQMWDEVLALPSEPPPDALSAVNSWQLIGPLYSTNSGAGYMTGRVRDIEALTGRVLAASGGLWRFNFGPIAMSESVPATWFGSFSSQPGNSNVILLGTGEFRVGVGTGLYKTTNGGATWAHKTMSPQPGYFAKVRWSPDGALAYAAGSGGFYRSTDAGETWTRTLTGTATDVATVGGGSYPLLIYVPITDDGLYRSGDGGLTFSKITSGGIPTTGTGDGAVSAPPHDLFTPGWIFVSFVDAGIWRSTNGGTTWTNITPTTNPHLSGYVNAIAASPTDPNYVLLGGIGVFRSTNGGTTWTPFASVHLHADYHAFSWNSDGIGVWAGNDGGWSHSTDRGLTWDSSSNVMPITQFYTIDCEKTEVGYMIGGTQDNGLIYTPNQALFWNTKGEADAVGACVDLWTLGRMWGIDGVYGEPYSFRCQRTTNGGATWQEVDTGIDPNSYWGGHVRGDNGFNPWLVMNVGPHVYDSVDGLTWTKSNTTPFPTNVGNLTCSTRVSPNAVAYACMGSVASGHVLYVRDGGTWVDRSAGLPTVTLRKVVPHPGGGSFANRAWALVNGTSTPGQKIFYTTNRGATWTNITGDLPNVPLGDLVVNQHDPSQLFVGSYVGCYRSTDGGGTWVRWNNGMSSGVMVTEMSYIDLTPSGGSFYVVAATYGRSVWKREISGNDPLAVVETEPTSSGLRLDVATANPFSEQATLRFVLPKPGHARLSIFDVRGARVSTVLDRQLGEGAHEASVNGRSLSPGIYYCRLESDGGSAVRKITVVR